MGEIKEYPHGDDWPKTLPSCKAQFHEGLPTEYLLYKNEETDMGYQHYDDYLTKVECDVNAFMRNAVTDRNLEQPFDDQDIPNYNATKNSGALNIRYNEGRGTTDYKPAHPEMFIGDLQASKETWDIKFAKAKRHTAARADLAQVAMGNDTDFQIAEQAWADPEISYAKKDMLKWVSNNLDWWQWPSFVNNSYTSAEGIIRDDKNRKNRHECAFKDYSDSVYHGKNVQNELGKVKKQNIGYNVTLNREQDQKGINFSEGFTAQNVSNQEPKDHQQAREAVKSESVNLVDNSIQSKVFKTKLAEAMKSAIGDQEMTQDMYNSVLGTVRKGDMLFDKKAVVKDTLKTQKEQNEIMTRTKKGVHPAKDHGILTRQTEGTLPYYLELNKVNMIKAARGEMDATKAQREIIQSYVMSKEVANRMKAGSCLRDNADRTSILRDIAHQHRTGNSNYNHCRKDGMAGRGQEESRKNKSEVGHEFQDDYHTKVRSSQKIVEQPKARVAGADFDDNTFTDFQVRDLRNSWH
tara:strand:+ start:8635 stop:10197 length:1563 start_codon:yes stop_codon:yes gene_type:complete